MYYYRTKEVFITWRVFTNPNCVLKGVNYFAFSVGTGKEVETNKLPLMLLL
jgi:hypothetical protein